MSEMLTERQVLEKLNIPNFRRLSKEHVLPFASLLPSMDPEVAKKALEQFPDFASASLNAMSEYKELHTQALQDNLEGMKACVAMYNRVMDSLQKMLEKDDISFEEKKYIIEQMKEIAEKVDAKDSENKSFLSNAMKIAGGVALGIIAILGAVLGSNSDTDALL